MKRFGKVIMIGVVLAGIIIRKDMDNKDIANVNISKSGEYCTLNVPYINQLEKYPTGCESVSSVMVLQYLGYDINVDTFIDDYLPRGTEPFDNGNGLVGDSYNSFFLGNPYTTSGFGCFAPVIEKALKQIVDGKHEVEVLYHQSLESLCHQYIDEDIPVILWATMYMQAPVEAFDYMDWSTGEMLTWIQPMHCLVLTGYDENYYYFNDPMVDANTKYLKADVEVAYRGLGSQAIVIL